MDLEKLFTTQIQVGSLFLPFTPMALMLELLLPLLLLSILGFLGRRISHSFIRKSTIKEPAKEKAQTIVRRILKIVQYILFLTLILRFLGLSVPTMIHGMVVILNTPFIAAGDIRISVITLLAIVPLLYLANWIGGWTQKMLDVKVFDVIGIDSRQRFSVGNLIRYGVMALFLLFGLSAIGISFSSLTALFAIFGVGIGFGLQTTVANFFSGLIIVVTRPIKQGDFIKATTADGTYEGIVSEIKLIYTVMNTSLNETIIIPNSSIVDNSVHNYSYDDPSVIYPIPIQVSYEEDLNRVQEILMDIGRACPYLRKGEEPRTQIFSFDNSGITLRLLITLDRASEKFACRTYVHQEIWQAFRTHGVTIPYPQMDVHMIPPKLSQGP